VCEVCTAAAVVATIIYRKRQRDKNIGGRACVFKVVSRSGQLLFINIINTGNVHSLMLKDANGKRHLSLTLTGFVVC